MIERKEKIGFDAFIYAVYCALIPLNMIMNFTGGTVNRYVGIIVIVLMAPKVFFSNTKIEASKPLVILVLFLFWCMTTVMWSIAADTSFAWIKTLFGVMALCIICCLRGFNQKEITMIKWFMMLSAAILVMFLAPNLDTSYTRGTLTSSAGSADQNSLAANILFSLWISFDLLQNTSKRSHKFICYISMMLMIIGLLFISSRGAMLALLISLFVYIFVLKKVKFKASVILLVVFAAILISQILELFEIVAFERLSIESVFEDSGTGRFGYWSSLLSFWEDSDVFRTLFGYGFATEKAISYRAMGSFVGCHNVFLEYLLTTGLIGLILLLLLFASLLRGAYKRKDGTAVVLIVSLFIICIPLGFFLDKGAWNVIMLGMAGTGGKTIREKNKED